METDKSIEKIESDGRLLAIVIRSTFSSPGLNFITPDEFPFQLGLHNRPKGTHIPPHKHRPFEELKDLPVQEFFFIESGSIQYSIYDGHKLVKSVTLAKGDMILLNCPHEMKFLEDSKTAELKQGPYRGKDAEKEYF